MIKNILIESKSHMLEDGTFSLETKFRDLDTATDLPDHINFARIGVSWAICVDHDKYSGRFRIITAYTGRAGKDTDCNPISVFKFHHEASLVVMLYTDTNSWDVDIVERCLWIEFKKRGISKRYKIGSEITIPIQIVNGRELNPIVDSRNYKLVSSREQDNAFREHYIEYRTYKRVEPDLREPLMVYDPIPEDRLMGYIIQQNQDGSKCIYHTDSYELWGWH